MEELRAAGNDQNMGNERPLRLSISGNDA